MVVGVNYLGRRPPPAACRPPPIWFCRRRPAGASGSGGLGTEPLAEPIGTPLSGRVAGTVDGRRPLKTPGANWQPLAVAVALQAAMRHPGADD